MSIQSISEFAHNSQLTHITITNCHLSNVKIDKEYFEIYEKENDQDNRVADPKL